MATLTFTALTTLSGRGPAETLGEALERVEPEPTGIGVFELEDGSGLWEIGGYFTAPPDETALALLAAAFGAEPFVVSKVPETDWVAHVRRELKPVEAGRFFVHGAHDSDKVPAGSVPLLIEASMAFGTGHHGTTLGCLRMLERMIENGDTPARVLDVGCGTAVLAMAAAQVCEGPVIASDIDEVAVEVANTNVRANGLVDRVRCIEAEGLDHGAITGFAPYDLIFANILKGPLMALAPAFSAASAPGGKVILSGILNHQAAEVSAIYAENGYNQEHCEMIVDWSTLVLAKTR